MADAPELTSMTRRKRVRPLVAAWAFVIVILVGGFIWLSLDPGEPPVPQTVAAQDHDISSPQDMSEDISEGISGDNFGDISIAPHVTAPAAEIVVESAAVPEYDDGDTPPDGVSLKKAPVAGLIVRGSNGPLPVLGPDSMVAWKEYARPVTTGDTAGEERPRVAIIVTGIGLNSKSAALAISLLPGQIDLGFSPYGRGLQEWMDRARKAGHEGFLMIPTEPVSYPENDPGPHTLMAGASARDNLKKLDWLLSQVTGYVGVMNDMGSKFTTSEADLQPILEDLHSRGLMFLDARSSRFSVAGAVARRLAMPRAVNNRYIDNVVSALEISRSLEALENTARTYGSALGVARALPLTMREITKWAEKLDGRGIDLVPVTAIANRQPIR